MRVLVITHPVEVPSVRFRFVAMLPLLAARGVQVERVDVPKGLRARLELFRRARGFDAVLYVKRLIPSWQFRYLRRCAQRLVFDFDDPIVYNKRGAEVTTSSTREKRFRTIVSLADLVTTHNSGFAALAREFGARRTEIVPMPVDLSRYLPRAGTGDGSILGWLGTRSNLPNLLTIAPALAGRTLRLVADAPLEIPGVRVVHVPWRAEDEPAELRRLDVALAPFPQDLWSRGKLPMKLIHYMAAGLPVVVSRGGAVETVARHGENALLAGTLDEWRSHIDRLSRDTALRVGLGRAARQTIERGHRLEAVVDRWIPLLRDPGPGTAATPTRVSGSREPDPARAATARESVADRPAP